jgi:hypothetical protein
LILLQELLMLGLQGHLLLQVLE